MIRPHPLLLAIAATALASFVVLVAHAQSVPIVYPAKGQSAQQQDADKYQCHGWAREQSGFDPMQPAPQSAAATQPTQQSSAMRGTTGGLVKGAAMGAAVGELAHNDAGRGAATGAIGGVVFESIKQRQAAQAQQQMAAQQSAQQQAQQQAARGQQKAVFDRAFGACMEARGYMVR